MDRRLAGGIDPTVITVAHPAGSRPGVLHAHDFVADVADDHGDDQPGHRGAPRLTGRNRNQPGQCPAEEGASSKDRSASASRVAELMRLPAARLHRAAARLPTMPMASAMPAPIGVAGR